MNFAGNINNMTISIEMPEAKEVVIAGLPVTYYESGTGSPLLLLHGWPQTSYIWRKVWPELQKYHHVFAVEMPGLGNSNALSSADTLSVANLIKSFCNQLHLDQVHLMAHDIGAWVAVTFALEYEHMLKSLIVLDAGIPGLMPDEIFSPANAKKIWQFYFHSVDNIPEYLIAGKESEYFSWYFTNKTVVKDAFNEKDLLVYIQAYKGENRLKSGFDYYRAFTKSAAQNKSYQKKLTLPILAAGAEGGQGLNMGIAMQKVAFNNVQSASIAECGHYIAEEQPARLLELVLEFLKNANT